MLVGVLSNCFASRVGVISVAIAVGDGRGVGVIFNVGVLSVTIAVGRTRGVLVMCKVGALSSVAVALDLQPLQAVNNIRDETMILFMVEFIL